MIYIIYIFICSDTLIYLQASDNDILKEQQHLNLFFMMIAYYRLLWYWSLCCYQDTVILLMLQMMIVQDFHNEVRRKTIITDGKLISDIDYGNEGDDKSLWWPK